MNMRRYTNVYFSEHTETMYVLVAAFADFRRLSQGLNSKQVKSVFCMQQINEFIVSLPLEVLNLSN